MNNQQGGQSTALLDTKTHKLFIEYEAFKNTPQGDRTSIRDETNYTIIHNTQKNSNVQLIS